MKVREVIPHTGPIPIVIPLRLFLDDINFPADNVTARVTRKFRGGGKVQQILYDATLRFQNWVSWPDKIHCLQDTVFKHTSLELLNCLVYSDTNLKNFQSILTDADTFTLVALRYLSILVRTFSPSTKFCRLQNSSVSRCSLQSYVMEIG